MIVRQAEDTAAEMLAQRATVFRTISVAADAERGFSSEFERMLAENDGLGAAACLMQLTCELRTADPFRSMSEGLSRVLCEWGDHAYYDDGDAEAAAVCFRLAAGLDLENWEASNGVVMVSCQGEAQRPDSALPYAVNVAHLNPSSNPMEYVLGHMEEDASKHQEEGADARAPLGPRPVRPPLALAWANNELSGATSLAGTAETLVVGAHGFYGLDLASGEQRWHSDHPGLLFGRPAISHDCVFAGKSMHAACYLLTTGHRVWERKGSRSPGPERDSATDDSPAAVMRRPEDDIEDALEGRIGSHTSTLCVGNWICYCDEHCVVLDARDGRVIFSPKGGSPALRATAGPCSNGVDLCLPGGRSIFVYRLPDARFHAEISTEGKIMSGPIVSADTVVIGTNQWCVEAYSIENGRNLWSFELSSDSQGIDSRLLAVDQRLFFGGPDGNLYALDLRTGEELWRRDSGTNEDCSPVVSGGIAYFVHAERGLCALSAESGETLWSGRFPELAGFSGQRELIVLGDTLVVGADRLCAFRVGEGLS
jgi:outer membrane protein assembly factor BamB